MKNLIVILGPTGIGKTELSLGVAEKYGTDIISADSRQIYRGMEIGTAAATAEQRARVRHHFVGVLAPTDYYSAAQFEADVLKRLEVLFAEKDDVVMTGGSMMYIDAVCRGIDDIPTVDDDTRQALREKYEAEGLERLVAELKLLDPEHYAVVDLKNPKRVIHALEICYMTGRTYTSFRKQERKQRPFNIIKIGLRRERDELYARINSRVEQMMAGGFLDEARSLYPLRKANALNTVGYKELFDYIDGKCSLDDAVEKIKRNTRVYSRKQVTWFKRDEEIRWFAPDDTKAVFECIERCRE